MLLGALRRVVVGLVKVVRPLQPLRAEVVVEDAPRDLVVLVGPRDVVRAEVVAVDALGGVVLVRLKVLLPALKIVLSEVETTAAGLDFQLTSMGFTRPPFFLLLHLP